MILAIETSCDETAVAISDSEGRPIVSKIFSQIEIHARYGGVVPELASRNHSRDLRPLCEAALSEANARPRDLSLIAATSGPGLASSLLVGNTFAKAMAVGLKVPFHAVNHLEGHLLSPFLDADGIIDPHIGLVVSGGHTLLIEVYGIGDYRLLGATKDDAAGEAFDKVGRLLGLPYPGGPHISKHAESGDPHAFSLPRSMMNHGNLDFSFSGLKTSARTLLDSLSEEDREARLSDFCASFQEAIVEVLVSKLIDACRATGQRKAAVSGGVSCNHRLRSQIAKAAEKEGIAIHLADPNFSTDNAAMIAFVAAMRKKAACLPSSLDGDINPNLKLGQ